MSDVLICNLGPAERSKRWLGHQHMMGIICPLVGIESRYLQKYDWDESQPSLPYSAGSELHEQGPQEHGREYILTAWGIRYWRTTYYTAPGLGFWTRRVFFTGHFIEVRIKIMPDSHKSKFLLLWVNTIHGLYTFSFSRVWWDFLTGFNEIACFPSIMDPISINFEW